MYCPIILGSDKTTVSVGTGNVEYHPLYLSIGNPHNSVRCAHQNVVTPIAFLAIPKGEYIPSCLIERLRHISDDHKSDKNKVFHIFKHQLYQASVAAILRPLRPGMEVPVIRRCPDGYFRKIIYDLVAFIANYPEQAMLTGIVQGWCPR